MNLVENQSRGTMWDPLAATCFASALGFYIFYLSIMFQPGVINVTSWLQFVPAFLFRPLGGLFFGALADTRGRKYAFVTSAKFMAAVSFLLTFIWPSSLGKHFEFLLPILMALFGFGLGGLFPCGAVYLHELVSEKKQGFVSAILQLSPLLGVFIAIAVLLLFKSVDFVPVFGESSIRLAYMLGILLWPFGVYVQDSLPEANNHTPSGKSFVEYVKEIFTNKALLKWMFVFPFFITVMYQAVGYTYSNYRLTFIRNVLQLNADFFAILFSVSWLTSIPMHILMGRLLDRFDQRKLGWWGSLIAGLLILPFYYSMVYFGRRTAADIDEVSLFVASALGSIIVPLSSTAHFVLLNQILPQKYRGIALGLLYNLGVVLVSTTVQSAGTYFITFYNFYYGAAIAVIVLLIVTMPFAFIAPKQPPEF